MVQHYGTLTLTFSPRNSLAIGNSIQIYSNALTFKTTTISISYKINTDSASTVTVTPSGTTVTFVLATTTGRTAVASTDVVTITLPTLRYPSQMSSQSITLTTLSTISCTADSSAVTATTASIESSTDSTTWIPALPSDLGSPTCVVSTGGDTTVCTTSSTVSCTMVLYATVSQSSAVVLDLSGLTLSASPGVTAAYFSVSSWSASKITLLTLTTLMGELVCGTDSSCYTVYFDISGLTLPTTTVPFSFTITTYVSGTVVSTGVVHKDSTAAVSATSSMVCIHTPDRVHF